MLVRRLYSGRRAMVLALEHGDNAVAYRYAREMWFL
jgi:hypothetical protein